MALILLITQHDPVAKQGYTYDFWIIRGMMILEGRSIQKQFQNSKQIKLASRVSINPSLP